MSPFGKKGKKVISTPVPSVTPNTVERQSRSPAPPPPDNIDPEPEESPDTNLEGRHLKFYTIDDGVILQVENSVYRLPRLLLNQSGFFQEHFRTPPSYINTEIEGVAEDRPFKPDGVTRLQMDSLLAVLRARLIDGDLPLSSEEWIAALHLSHKWGFLKAKTYAIKSIEKLELDPVTRILLARRYDVPTWLKEAYVDLCTRPQPLKAEDGEKIGMCTCMAISNLREQVLFQVLSIGLLDCGTCLRRCYCKGSRVPYVSSDHLCSACSRGCDCVEDLAHRGVSAQTFAKFPRDIVERMVAETTDLQV